MGKAGFARLVVSGAFLALSASFAVPTAGTFATAFRKKGKASVQRRIASARKAAESRFPQRLTFVTLNGLFVRLVGQHSCNGVVKTKPHGILLQPHANLVKTEKAAGRMRRFSDFCERHGAKFLYVQLPRKLDVSNRILPAGVVERANDNVRRMLGSIAEAGVAHVDVRADFAATPDDVARNFYRTDHHWRNDAAFRMAGRLAAEIAVRCAAPEADAHRAAELLSPDAWTREVHPCCFLGSLGRRTGPLFAGLDDLAVLRPRFATRMSISIPSKRISLSGTFEDTNMRRADEALAGSKSFVTDAYSALYVGGIYPLVVHENRNAPLRKRVLLIGDSFARPVEAFLSVAVRRLDVVDPRRTARNFSIAGYVRQTKPDIVIQMINPSSLGVDKMKGPKTGRAAMFEYGL
ncbi:MAG: hypothetical protein IKF72_13500 [Kiritimatiellae bacterium]|nr:hypothetical protein [Kiritimatiellia bacterium]